MINYVEKGMGLHEAVEAAGERLWMVDGTWVSSNDQVVQAIINNYTLDQAKAYRFAESKSIGKAKRDAIIAHASAGEMATWPIKRDEANSYVPIVSEADPTACPFLKAEAQYRNISLAEIVAKVKENTQRFQAAEAAIGGIEGKHRDNIAALNTFEEVLAYDLTADYPVI